jgi:hypothetical protein
MLAATLAAMLAVAVVLLAGGCMYPYAGMNMQSEQQRSLEESRATQAVAATSTKAEGPAGVTVNQGTNSTATIAPPAPTKFEHSASRSIGEDRGTKTEEAASWVQKNPWTILLIAVGLGVLFFVVTRIIAYVKSTAVYQTAQAAVAPIVTQIKAAVALKAATTDAATMAKLDAEIARLNSLKADAEKSALKK